MRPPANSHPRHSAVETDLGKSGEAKTTKAHIASATGTGSRCVYIVDDDEGVRESLSFLMATRYATARRILADRRRTKLSPRRAAAGPRFIVTE